MLNAGVVFGIVRVLATLPRRSADSHLKYEVFCDPVLGGCGTKKWIREDSLKHGATRSCGCKQFEGWIHRGITLRKYHHTMARKRMDK